MTTKPKLTFFSTCVGWPAHDVDRPGGLIDMFEGAREVSRARFMRLVDSQQRRDMERALGYAARAKDGLTIAKDYHVCTKTGWLHGQRVAFLVHSAIEHVFVPKGFVMPA